MAIIVHIHTWIGHAVGADLNIGPTDPPNGDSALWMACNTTDGTIDTRPTEFGPFGQFYRPSEITNMLTTGTGGSASSIIAEN